MWKQYISEVQQNNQFLRNMIRKRKVFYKVVEIYNKLLLQMISLIFTKENVTVRNCPPLSINFFRFVSITTTSLPSTKPAATSSAAIPWAESTPTVNSNLMSLSSRLSFLKELS